MPRIPKIFVASPNINRAEVVGNRVNRGAGHGLEVPVHYHFYGPRKAIMWVKKRLSEANRKIEEKLKSCMKNAI